MRAVLDTNIFISALVSATGAPSRLVDAWIDGEFTLCSHPIQLDELRDVTRREKLRPLIRSSDAGRLVNQIVLMAQMPKRLPHVRRSADPGDDFLLAVCEAADADRLVTGDKSGLLDLRRHAAARIVTASQLAQELGLKL